MAHDGSHRGSAVARLYGYLVRRYVDPVMALSIARLFDEQRNEPPLGRAEVDRICNEIADREADRREAEAVIRASRGKPWASSASSEAQKQRRKQRDDEDAELEQLAKLSLFEFYRARKAAAESLCSRLDPRQACRGQTRRARARWQRQQARPPVRFRAIDPWPKPVDGAQLLDEISM